MAKLYWDNGTDDLLIKENGSVIFYDVESDTWSNCDPRCTDDENEVEYLGEL